METVAGFIPNQLQVIITVLLNAGTYDIQCSAPCYADTGYYKMLLLTNKNTTVVDIQLQPCKCREFTANRNNCNH